MIDNCRLYPKGTTTLREEGTGETNFFYYSEKFFLSKYIQIYTKSDP